MATSTDRKRASLAANRTTVLPRVKVWIEAGGEHVFCSRMCRIVRAIEETGSIKEAAVQVGLSYRHVWGLLRRVETSLGRPLVDAHVGGAGARRTALTDTGRAFVAGYERLQDELHAASDRCAAELRAALRSPR